MCVKNTLISPCVFVKYPNKVVKKKSIFLVKKHQKVKIGNKRAQKKVKNSEKNTKNDKKKVIFF